MRRFLRFMVPAVLCVCLTSCSDGPPPPPPDPIDALFNHGLDKMVMNTWDGSDWLFGAKTLYTYASGKRLIRKEGGPGPEDGWKPIFGYDYSYDAEGRLETGTQFSYVAGVRQDDLQWRYFYDAEGQLETAICYYESGGSWYLSLEREHVYDAFGRLTSRTEYDATVIPRYPDYRFIYAYDADSRVTTRTDYAWSGASWLPSHREMFVYDVDDRITEYTDGGWNGTTFTPYGQYSYAYDAGGKVEVVTRLVWSGAWEATQRVTYIYDAVGIIQSRLRENSFGGVWTENARWDHSYTEYGSSYLLEGCWYAEPFAQWILDYYGAGEVNRYRW